MRIAIVTPGFSATEDDWCIPALLDLVRRLAERHDVYVLALRYPHDAREYIISGARVHSLGGADASGITRVPPLIRAINDLRSEHMARPFDVIHGLWADEPGFVATSGSLLTGVPAIVSVMGGELVGMRAIGYGGQLNLMNRWLTHFALRRARLVTAGSEYQRALTSRVIPSPRVVATPLGVDTSLFSPESSAGAPPLQLPGEPSLLTVASLAPVKDHAALIRALERLRVTCPDARLHLVGGGDQADLKRLGASLGVGSAVVFHGDVRHERLPSYYRAADLFALTSWHESQGLAPLEAAACGCPVVGTAVGVMSELDPTASPPPADPDELADRLSKLWRSPAERRRRKSAGFELVRDTFALDRTVERLESLYESLRVKRVAW